MKLYCFSDLHLGAFPVPDPIPDAWLFAGDLYQRPVLGELTASDVEFRKSVNAWQASHSQPVYAVRGNHDCQDKAGFFRNNHDLSNGSVHKLGCDVFLAGLGWSGRRHFDLPMETNLITQCEAVKAEWVQHNRPRQLILITHYPPHFPVEMPRTRPCRGWYLNCIADLIDAIKPQVVIAGHCHEHFLHEYRRGETQILFPGPKGRWVEL